MSADVMARLRTARPQPASWADTTDGRDTWELTERRGFEAECRPASSHGRRVRSSRWLVATAGVLVLVGGTGFATVTVPDRSSPPAAIAGVKGRTATGRLPAGNAGSALEHARVLDRLDRSILLRPTWLPVGFDLIHQGVGPSGSPWSQSWAGPAASVSTSGPDDCRFGPPDITVDQGAGIRVPAGSGDERLAAEPAIDGVRATVVRTGDDELTVTWTPLALPSSGAVQVSSGKCPGNPVSSLVTLLRVARGLR